MRSLVLTLSILILLKILGCDSLNFFLQQSQCPTDRVRIRRSWTTLSYEERKLYVDLVVKMKNERYFKNGITYKIYDFFTQVHNTNSRDIHGTSFFYPAHRYLTFLFECALQWMAKQYATQLNIADPCGVTLPYWDWLLDYEDNTKDDYLPQNNSAIFLDSLLGPPPPNTSVSVYDIASGAFSGASVWPVFYPTNNIPDVNNFSSSKFGPLTYSLKRLFSSKVPFVYGPSQMASDIIKRTTYINWTPFSDGFHNIPHRWLSFQMQTMASPDDPIFWLHHAMMDRVWALHQDCHGNELATGDQLNNPALYTAINKIDPKTNLPYMNYGIDGSIPFNYSFTIDSVLIPRTSYPSPRQVWGLGISGTDNFDGLYVRYGPDSLVPLLTGCPDQKWTLVNQGQSVKRSHRHREKNEESADKAYKKFRDQVRRGKSAKQAITDAALEECQSTPPVEMDDSLLAWMIAQGTSPEQYDRVCDTVSQKFCKGRGKHFAKCKNSDSEVVDEIVRPDLQASEASVIGVGVAIVAVVVISIVIVIVIIYRRNQRKDQNNDDYITLEN